MNFFQSIRACFRKYFDFTGRATRSEFWWFQLFAIIVTIAMTLIDSLIFGYNWENTFTPLAFASDIVTIAPIAAVTARRFHDIGMSGWWQLPIFAFYLIYLDVFIPGFAENAAISVVVLVAGIYSLWLLIRLIKDGDPHTNKYGPNPKAEGQAEVFM